MLRRQILLHSYLYYGADENIIDDHEWDKRARALFSLQQEHGWNINFYDGIFRHWKGQSGYWLPTNKGCDENVVRVASRLLAGEKFNRANGGVHTPCGTLPPEITTPEMKQQITDIFNAHRPKEKA